MRALDRVRTALLGAGTVLGSILGCVGTAHAGAGCDTPYIEAKDDAGAASADQTAPEGSDSKGTDSLWDRDALTGTWNGWRPKLEQFGVKLGLQEQSEVWANLAGGLRRGAVYDGLTTGCLTLDLGRLVHWPGAIIYAKAYQIHGRGPSGNLVGNLQFASSAEATRDTKLYQLWFEQTLFDKHLSIRIGQGGINDELMTSDYAAVFANASFGLSGLTAADLPSGGPTYPMGTPFVRIQGKPDDRLTISAALFNGDPAPPGIGDPQLRDRGGLAFRTDAHALVVGEVAYAVNKEDGASGDPATYKLGFWYHSGHFADQRFDTNGVSLASPASNGTPRDHASNFAVYGIVDQMIWAASADKKKGVGMFLQVTVAPAAFNPSNLFIAAGVNWMGPFNRPETDIFAVGVAYLGLSPARRQFGSDLVFFTGSGSPYRGNETVVEATYQFQVAPWWQVQPDLQIVVNPGAGIPPVAGGKPLGTAVVAGLRTTITF